MAFKRPAAPKAKKRALPGAKKVNPAITNPVFTKKHAIAARGTPTNPHGGPGQWVQHGNPPLRGGGNAGDSAY